MLLVHGLESLDSFISFFFIIRIRTTQFVQPNSYVSICIQIETYKFIGFCTNSYKIIQLFYELNSMNSYKVSFLFFLSLCKQAASARAARAKPVLRARSASRKRAARAARAKPELRARSASRERAARAARAKPEHTSCPDQAAPGCPDH